MRSRRKDLLAGELPSREFQTRTVFYVNLVANRPAKQAAPAIAVGSSGRAPLAGSLASRSIIFRARTPVRPPVWASRSKTS